MSGFVRRAGTGFDASGATVVWSVAEGGRGRRWREARSTDGGVVSSLLLETDPDGRFSHTELATGAGLLTLHPESDGTVHGNVVGADGIRHIAAMPWERDGVFLVEGSPISAAAATLHLHRSVAVGARMSTASIVVFRGLRVQPAPIVVKRVAETAWQLGTVVVDLDADGIPVLADSRTWPLENGVGE